MNTKIENAIISVSDKTKVIELAQVLDQVGVNLFSTGNTYKNIKAQNVKISFIEDLTGMGEILGGRVRTLHPKVHGGILYRRDQQTDKQTIINEEISSIDLVVANLYPFKSVTQNSEIDIDEAIENIDIGGVTLLRAAAKNYKWVTVICDINDYDRVMEEVMLNGNTSLETRQALAVKAFQHTMDYDTAIANFLNHRLMGVEHDTIQLKKISNLRYGENPHQQSTLYQTIDQSGPLDLTTAEILHGKEMSHNNYLDSDSAISTCSDFPQPTAVVVKHQNPCGIATGNSIDQALEKAWEGDIVSSFGSVISLNRTLNLKAAQFLEKRFVEVIIAPDFEPTALEFLQQKSKNLRLLKLPHHSHHQSPDAYRQIQGGFLKQEIDYSIFDANPPQKLEWVSPHQESQTVTLEELDHHLHYAFSFTCVKHIKSNAIAITHEYAPGQFMLIGMGAGQPNRVDAVRKLALVKMTENLERLYPDSDKRKEVCASLILSSDAFFPFKDNVEFAKEGGITKIIQPGGSTRDSEVIEEARKNQIEMVFTHTRHFLH